LIVMGRSRKGYNQKAREGGQETTSDKNKSSTSSGTTTIEVKLDTNLKQTKYGVSVDDTNAFVLEKKDKAKRTYKVEKARKLSKTQRKRLEKIVEKKQKKGRRAELLKELEKHAVSQEELDLMSSATRLGQLNRKRKLSETVTELSKQTVEQNILSSISKGRKRAKKVRLLKKVIEPLSKPSQDKPKSDSESDSNDDDDDDDDEDDEGDTNSDEDKDAADKSSDPADEGETHESSTQDKNSDNCSEELTKQVVQFNDPGSKSEEANSQSNKAEPSKPDQMTPRQPVVFVEVNRDPEIQAARLQLPILAEEQIVMEAIKENDVVIVCGETGSGKTTQVPQFLYEAGYTNQGMIGVTEPRRVAAVSMSERVAKEMNMDTSKVSYQIRYQGNCTGKTVIKFMTDGVLLKEVENDFLLSKYSVIVIDEAHERSVFTDILIGLLSRIVPLRNKQDKELKLIIMSATLRTEDFTENARLFPSPPLTVKIDSRQFPVTVHFNKRTPDDYIEETFRKVSKIHRTLPSGGILVFVTGQSDVHSLSRKLCRSFPYHKGGKKQDGNTNDGEKNEFDLNRYPVLPLTEECEPEDELDDTELDQGDGCMDDSAYTPMVDHSLPLYVLPLYSLLSSKEQAKVFKSAPEGTRLCVIATNVAETSLTIPNIKYVVDTGLVKRRYYDKITGVSSFKVTWTSKASANQRAGRAGRVEPGHCYRLYSSAVFTNDFEEFAEAEILRRPVDDLMLQMKSININKVVNFPFPTPPSSTALQAAETLLLDLGALENMKTVKGNINAVITPLGRAMSSFSVSPRYAKMLCLGHQQDCSEYIIAIVSALTVNEIFIDDMMVAGFSGDKEDFKKRVAKITQLRRSWAGYGEAQKLGDLMVLLRAVGACEYAGSTEKFCFDNGLRHKGMTEIRKLRTQLTNVTNLSNPDSQIKLDPQMKPPTVEQCRALRQIALAGLGDRVAKKIPLQELKDPKLKNAYICDSLEEPVFIHPKSALFKVLPEYIVYQEIMETTKLFMKGVTAVEPDWLPVLVPNKCCFSKPEENPQPRYDDESGIVKCHMTSTFGTRAWQIPTQELEYPSGLERFKWFARFLLEGKVIPALQKYVPFLLGTPMSMIKSWSKLQPRTEVLLSELVSANADSREGLLQAFKADEKFLLNAFKQWIPKSKHKDLADFWPPH
ncbi:hypothetical protein QZH41_008586, partial [Actinostola sp. cb2023]